MQLRILGSAAGGRFPQWNCGCENCVAARTHKFPGKSRTQAQLALSSNGSNWFLAGASPDLAFQIEATPQLHPRALRDSPISGVILASADLDHVLGLLLLREVQPLRVYAAPSVLRILREENSMFGMLNRVERQVVWSPIKAGFAFSLVAPDERGFRSLLRSRLSLRTLSKIRKERGPRPRSDRRAVLRSRLAGLEKTHCLHSSRRKIQRRAPGKNRRRRRASPRRHLLGR